MKGIPRIRSSSVQNGSVKLTQLSPEEHQVVLRLLAPSDALAVYPPLPVTERSNAATEERLKSGHAVGGLSIV